MKKFKPFDKVLVRIDKGCRWYPEFYSHSEKNLHHLIMRSPKEDENIIPYEGNEHLVGKYDEPEEEIQITTGQPVFAFDDLEKLNDLGICLENFVTIDKPYSDMRSEADEFLIIAGNYNWKYCIPFNKFNIEDMEATKKEVLTVKDGRLVKVNK